MKNNFDFELKRMIKKNDFTEIPEIVRTRIDDTLASLPEKGAYESMKSKKKLTKRMGIAAALVAMLAFTLPVAASSISELVAKRTKEVTDFAVSTKGYIILDGYYYRATGEMLSEEKLGDKIAEINRIGEWQIKRSGDSNVFPPGVIYSIKGKDVKETIAVRVSIGKEDKGPYGYVVLLRSEKVEQPDINKIIGAKNDPEEVAIALTNIRAIAPYLYELKTEQNGVTPNLATYRSDNGVTLCYSIPEADDNETQGFLFVYEYPKEIAEKITNSAFSPEIKSEIVTIDGKKVKNYAPDSNYKPPTASETFELNGIQWSYYGDHLLRGEKEGYYYEVQTQGKFTHDSLVRLLKDFNQHGN